MAAAESDFDKGYIVRLNDLSAAFDTRVAECMPQVYPEGHRCSPTHPFRDKDSGMLDIGSVQSIGFTNELSLTLYTIS